MGISYVWSDVSWWGIAAWVVLFFVGLTVLLNVYSRGA
uniref:Transmembrane protein n=1 Tax=Ralstonia pickettii (strain 12D) TaxID=428406 RepID=C6BNQ8_RALP1